MELMQIDRSIALAIEWLTRSRIQNVDGNKFTHGSFNSYFVQGTGAYPFAYTEATGYGLSLLVYLSNYLLKHRLRLVHRAELAYSWLLKMQDEGLFRHRYVLPNGPLSVKKYTFDSAVCGTSLIKYFKITNKEGTLVAVRQTADSLLKLQQPDGSISAVIPEVYESNHWSQRFNIHHAKVAMFWTEAGEVLQDSRYIEAAERLCDLILSRQTRNGFFRLQDERGYIHAHCYACEGLLFVGRALQEVKYEESALKGVSWLSKFQNIDGSMNQRFPKNGDTAVDILAQSIQLWLIHEKQKFSNNISRGINTLIRQQYLNGSVSIRGAFPYSSSIHDANSWSTMFAIKALMGFVHGTTDVYELL